MLKILNRLLQSYIPIKIFQIENCIYGFGQTFWFIMKLFLGIFRLMFIITYSSIYFYVYSIKHYNFYILTTLINKQFTVGTT